MSNTGARFATIVKNVVGDGQIFAVQIKCNDVVDVRCNSRRCGGADRRCSPLSSNTTT